MAHQSPPILPVAIGAFAIVAYLLLVDLSLGVFSHPAPKNTNTSLSSACKQDVMKCPAGEFVGRTEPNCAFASCQSTGELAEASGLKEYRDDLWSFEYPAAWGDPGSTVATPETDQDLYAGSVAQMNFTDGQRVGGFFGLFSDGVDGALPYWLESATLGECVNGLMTYTPSHVGAKFPCEKVTINGHAGVFLIRNVAQEGCYALVRDYYLDWTEGPYKHFVAEQPEVEVFDVTGPNGEIFCTQNVNVQARMQEVMDKTDLTTEQQRRADQFDAVVKSMTAQ